MNNGPPSKPKGFGPPATDSDEDDYSSQHESSDEESEADDGPAEVPDSGLDDAAKLVRAAERKEQGNDYFKKKDYANATRLYTAAIQLDPKNPAYLTNRAASRMGSKQFEAALDDCLNAAALQSAAPQSKTLLRLARCQLALGRVEPAQQTLDQLLKLDGANPQVQQERARCARIANHVSNVKRELANKNWSMVLLGVDAAAREVESTPKEWRTWKVEALIGKKQYDAASAMAADLLRMDQNQPEPLYYRGLCLYLSGNHPQAIAHCQSALRNDPDFTLARTLLKKVKLLDSIKDAGNDAFKRQAWQEAVDKYTEALGVDEENESYRATLLNNRATAYLKMKKYDEALADCDACLAINDQYFKALRTRGRVNLANEDWEAAVRDFKAAYEIAPAGSNDEAALKKDVQEAEGALKRSKLKDHYKTLGVEKDASETEIKKAYRKMSLIHHPDKGGSDEKFKEIGEAYAILSDPQRRRKFDMGIDENDPSGGMGGDPFGGGVDINDLFGGGGGFSFGGGGPFGGGGFGGGGGRRGGNPYGF